MRNLREGISKEASFAFRVSMDKLGRVSQFRERSKCKSDNQAPMGFHSTVALDTGVNFQDMRGVCHSSSKAWKQQSFQVSQVQLHYITREVIL